MYHLDSMVPYPLFLAIVVQSVLSLLNISALFYVIIPAAAKKYTGTEKYNKMTAKNKNKKLEKYL